MPRRAFSISKVIAYEGFFFLYEIITQDLKIIFEKRELFLLTYILKL